eukprot:652171-Prorocentrum_lima.AAC.1
MTSSLVGSEMCIRDRCMPDPEFAAYYNTWMVERPTYYPPELAHPPVTTPVSYTHLTLPTICSV